LLSKPDLVFCASLWPFSRHGEQPKSADREAAGHGDGLSGDKLGFGAGEFAGR
jgi:hypothetical protein